MRKPVAGHDTIFLAHYQITTLAMPRGPFEQQLWVQTYVYGW